MVQGKISDSYWPLLLAAVMTYISFLYEPIMQAYIEQGFLRGYLVIGVWFIYTFVCYLVLPIFESFIAEYMTNTDKETSK